MKEKVEAKKVKKEVRYSRRKKNSGCGCGRRKKR